MDIGLGSLDVSFLVGIPIEVRKIISGHCARFLGREKILVIWRKYNNGTKFKSTNGVRGEGIMRRVY